MDAFSFRNGRDALLLFCNSSFEWRGGGMCSGYNQMYQWRKSYSGARFETEPASRVQFTKWSAAVILPITAPPVGRGAVNAFWRCLSFSKWNPQAEEGCVVADDAYKVFFRLFNSPWFLTVVITFCMMWITARSLNRVTSDSGTLLKDWQCNSCGINWIWIWIKRLFWGSWESVALAFVNALCLYIYISIVYHKIPVSRWCPALRFWKFIL